MNLVKKSVLDPAISIKKLSHAVMDDVLHGKITESLHDCLLPCIRQKMLKLHCSRSNAIKLLEFETMV